MDIRYYAGFLSEWLGVIAVAWIISVSPRFQQQPPIGFKYARRDGIMALSLYGLILLFSILFNSFSPLPLPDPLRPASAPLEPSGQALTLAVLSLAAFGVALVIRRQPVRSLGWNPATLRPALLLGVALAVLTIFLRNRVMDVLSGINMPGVTVLLLALGISAAEETIFRGYIQLRLAWWLGPWQGIVLSAVLFTLWHLPAWVTRLPLDTTLIIAGLTLAQGLVLGWLMYKSKNVAAPVLYRAFSIWVQFFA